MYGWRMTGMNQSALEGFVKIVELDSFSEAADALFLSQSALSQQIRALEAQLKVQLFQDDAVSESIKERTVRCGIYNGCLLYTSPSPRDA